VIEWLGFGTAQEVLRAEDCAGSPSWRGESNKEETARSRLMGRAGRATLRTGAGDARAQNGRADYGVSRRSRSRKNIRENLDHFLLPMPFARAVILFAPPIFVPKDASVELMDAKHAEMQKELERVRDVAEAWFTQSDEERERHREEFQK